MSAVKAIFNLMDYFSNQYERLEVRAENLPTKFCNIKIAFLTGTDDVEMAKMIRGYITAMKPVVDAERWRGQITSDNFPESFNKIYNFLNN